ncbi:MAG: ABC transporter permease subunit [Methanocella sp.]
MNGLRRSPFPAARSLLLPGALLLVWSLLAVRVPFIPAPLAVLTAMWRALGKDLPQHALLSAFRVVAALLLAITTGPLLGLLMGRLTAVDRAASPLVFSFYPLPKIAFLPLVMLAFGLADFSRIFLIWLTVFFHLVVAARDAVRSVEAAAVDSVLALGASEADLYRHVFLPAILPRILTVLRISVGTAVAVLFFVESFATWLGLGHYVMDAWQRIDYTRMFVGILALSLLGLVLFKLVDALERLCCPWVAAVSASRPTRSRTGAREEWTGQNRRMAAGVSGMLGKPAIRRFVAVFAANGVWAVELFIAAGTVRWPRAWLYVGLVFAGFVVNGLVLALINPELANERGKRHEGTKGFDKVFGLLYLVTLSALPVIAGLDARFGWSHVPFTAVYPGVALFVLGSLLVSWVMAVNRNLETTVRIQKERGHAVTTTGPYRIVRHPMYLGVILQTATLPLIVGSLWSWAPVGVSIVLFVFRTALEDRTLCAELPGYREYAQRTRYRLLPLVW